MKFLNYIFLSFIGLAASVSAWSQIEGTNGFLMGPTIEIGINAQGYEGSSVGPSFPNHARGVGTRLGFVSNPADDGWVNYDGDFYLPGSPENTFGIQIDGIDYQNSAAFEYDIPMTGAGLSNYTELGKCKLIDWDGSIGGIDIHMTYKLDTTTTYYVVDVTLTNTNPVPKNNVYFYKTFDPDNNQPIGWSFMTTNTIEYQPDPFCPKSLVSATQTSGWTSYVGLGAIDPNTRVSWGGFAVPSGSDIFNGTGGLTGTELASTFCDCAISISHKETTIAAGASANFQFVVILSSEQVEEAIQSLYTIDYEGAEDNASCTEILIDVDMDGDLDPQPDTIDFDCSGGDIELEFAGPYVGPSYSIQWYNHDTGLLLGTGPSLTVSPIGTTMYRVVANPIGDCFELPIERFIVVQGVGVGPHVEFTDPGPQCNEIAIEDLIIIDTMALPGTYTTFHGSEPDAIDDMSDLWDGSPIGPDDEVWVMISDPDGGGCYDILELEIEFIEIDAGPDSTGYEVCNSGLEIVEFITFVSDTALVDEGYMWEEVTPSGGAFNPATSEFDPTGVPAGDYTVRFIALSGPDCESDTSLHTITVQNQPTSGADGVGEICNMPGLTYDLNTLLVDQDPGGIWEETTASGAFNPMTGILDASGLAAADYDFEYITLGTLPCVNDTARFTITVNPAPIVDAGLDKSICIGDDITLSGLGTPGVTYVWDPAYVIDGTPFTPTEVEIGHYTVTGTDANGCIAVDDMNLTVNALPVISFSADNIGCTDFETEFTIVSDVAISTTDWTFGDGDVAFGMTNPITPHVYFDGGVYTVKATVTDINGCVSSETYTDYITVEDHPIAAFTFSPQSVYTNDTEIEFTNESMYSTDYSWDFGDGTPMTNETDPIHFFPSEVGDVFYPVELKATNYLGCVDSVTAYINVKSIILFYIPNAFTPDGDQYNQEFKPVFESGYDPYDYKMVIYNRYGEIIFETHDVNYGWSGTYGTNGELVQNGVYTWAIDFKELHTDKRYSHSGHITVLK